MSMQSIIEFLAQRQGAKVALVVHQRPDGDALGSAVGLADTLTQQGWPTKVVNPLPLPAYLDFIAYPDLLAFHEQENWLEQYDCVGVLDCGEITRLDEHNRAAAERLPTFTIDHHASTLDGLGQAVWVEAEASSTGEMVTRLCREAGWPVSPRAAQGLWTAILTDTGRFSYENTSAKALEAARYCVECGASPADAAASLYQSVSLAERKLQTTVLLRMELYEQERLAVSWLRAQDFAQAKSGVEDSQNLINILRDTTGVEVAIFLYEPPVSDADRGVKASFRSKAPLDCLDVVRQFGGGGHQRAAGCTLPGPIEEARKTIVAAARQAFFRIGHSLEKAPETESV